MYTACCIVRLKANIIVQRLFIEIHYREGILAQYELGISFSLKENGKKNPKQSEISLYLRTFV